MDLDILEMVNSTVNSTLTPTPTSPPDRKFSSFVWKLMNDYKLFQVLPVLIVIVCCCLSAIHRRRRRRRQRQQAQNQEQVASPMDGDGVIQPQAPPVTVPTIGAVPYPRQTTSLSPAFSSVSDQYGTDYGRGFTYNNTGFQY